MRLIRHAKDGSEMIIRIRKNGQTASKRTRKIINRGLGVYMLIEDLGDDLKLECLSTRWRGVIPKREIIVQRMPVGGNIGG